MNDEDRYVVVWPHEQIPDALRTGDGTEYPVVKPGVPNGSGAVWAYPPSVELAEPLCGVTETQERWTIAGVAFAAGTLWTMVVLWALHTVLQ